MLIEWNEALATGNGAIDEQHKELIGRFSALLNACNQGKGREEVGRLLTFMAEYVRSHFSMEEGLQKRYGYPEYAAHKEEHDGFIQDLQELEHQFGAEGATLSLVIQTNQAMVDWLIRHINGTDRKLAAFLRAHA